MNINYIDYAVGETYKFVEVPFLRQVPMQVFIPPPISTGSYTFRLNTIAEFQAYIRAVLTNEISVDIAWAAQTIDINQNVTQGGLVYRFGNTLAMWTGYAFTYVWPPRPFRRDSTYPEELYNNVFDVPRPSLNDPRVKYI